MFLLTNGWIITFNQTNQVIENGAVAVEGSSILDVDTTAALRKKYPTSKTFNIGGKFILPGMINAHTHLYSAFACGMSRQHRDSPANFSQILEQIWWKLDRALTLEDIYYSALVTGIQAIKSGTTTLFDHHSSPSAVSNSLDKIAQAVTELGLRANLCYEVSDRDGKKKAKKAIAENIRWIERNRTQQATPLLAASFGLHASFTLSDATLQEAAELGNQVNSGFHIHLAEAQVDQEITKRKYRKSVVKRLADLEILGRKTITAHGIHISETEMALLKETDTIVVHNPSSNMNNAVGVAPVPAMLKNRILVGLGTDGLGNDMFTELRTASLVHKFANRDPRVFPPKIATQLAISNNRKIASRFFSSPIGMIAPGYTADVVIVDHHASTPITSHNITTHLVYGMLPTKVDTVFINGKKVLENGKMVTVEEGRIFAQARSLAHKLWKRI
jgi:putative selenium metabolism protein SsnA